jgi:hypothetical protein
VTLQRDRRGIGLAVLGERVPAHQPVPVLGQVGVERHERVHPIAELAAAVEQHDVRPLAGLDGRAEQGVVLVERLGHELDLDVRVFLREVGLRRLDVGGRGVVARLPVPHHQFVRVAAGRRVRSGGAPAAGQY